MRRASKTKRTSGRAPAAAKPAVLVIGDAMLDHYICGRAERLSPEAPVPIVSVEEQYYRPGGAANVAYHLAKFRARPILMALVGRDDAGRTLMRLASGEGIRLMNLAESTGPDRPTTQKVRIISRARTDLGLSRHQFLRVDREETAEIDEALRARVLDETEKLLVGVSAVVLSDYRKGMLPASLVADLVQKCRESGKLVLADFKNPDGSAYRGCDCVCLSVKEAAAVLGRERAAPDRAVKDLARRLKCKVVVKAAERGVYASSGRSYFHVPARARAARTTEGAGDVFLAALTTALARGRPFRAAVESANKAAGRVVSAPHLQTLSASGNAHVRS